MQAIAEFRPARRAWLVAIALGHLAVLMAWRPAARHGGPADSRPDGALVLLTLSSAIRPRPLELPPPPPRIARAAPVRADAGQEAGREAQAAPARPAPPPVASHAALPDAPPAATDDNAPRSITLPAAAAGAADPFAQPVAPGETLREKLRRSAAGIDRQLRKESLNKFATIVNDESAAGLSISGGPARAPAGPENFTSANGIVHKRYMLRGEMVCEEVDHIGVGGHDPFRNGSKVRLVKCPK